MKIYKKLLVLIVSALLIAYILPASAFAGDDDFTFTAVPDPSRIAGLGGEVAIKVTVRKHGPGEYNQSGNEVIYDSDVRF